MTDTTDDVFTEVRAFQRAELWQGGFLDCDPLNPLSWSSYTSNGFVSIYHAVYMAAIKPYLPPGGKVLEIGPGHGAWTKCLLAAGARKVVALDVQSREFNGIDAWLLEEASKLEYHVVSDLSCNEVEDNQIDFFWSFGAFVHMSADVQRAYLNNAFRKLKSGCNCFVQFADVDKWNSVVKNPNLQILNLIASVVGGADGDIVRRVLHKFDLLKPRDEVGEAVKAWNDVSPGRYYYIGQSEIRNIAENAGYIVHSSDWMPSLRDPIIHFSKP